MKVLLTSCVFLAASMSVAMAEKIPVHSGTGFFINADSVITNEHVVHGGCSRIIIYDKGKGWGQAQLVAADRSHDLALLHTPAWSRDTALISHDVDNLKSGDAVFAVGYPDETLKNGKDYEVANSTILNTEDSFGDTSMIQFAHVVKQGYSGGALLDGQGRVVGVVKGIAELYETRALDGVPAEKSVVKQADEAINLLTLEQFLLAHNVKYAVSTQARAAPKKLDFTINVQCEESPAK